ncbi:MAG: hypothetical protein J4O03_16920 [Chloroflexi bacterium]|nr:hypothetical protein [Chloroflexota bacterium]MCI0797666.1 hypothetical protein [Chloroflexota bacterium]MCI0866148.1 hypothetical protein [Chloroflexota bacterium]MCI0877885.1 hypothetical protein [Chloroflexota bacterium]MCI0894614.1 hypothetical protein [Chloroflexota bacterium]
MTAFMILLEEDLGAMMRSWMVWMWLGISGVGGLSGVIFAGAFDQESTSFLLGWFLVLYVALGSFVVMTIGSSSGGTDPRTLGTSIISHGVTPIQFVLALLTSRTLIVLGMCLVIITPVAFAMMGNGVSNDLDPNGILIALIYTGLLLTVLVFLSVTFSAVVTNTPGSLGMIYILWYTAITLLLAIQAEGFSPVGVLGRVPALLQGEFQWSLHRPILVALLIPLVVLPPLGIRMFGQRDL